MVYIGKVIDKAIVWDMDETLGSFVSLSEPVALLEELLGRKLKQKEFMLVIEIFEEVLRPNIIDVLIYIKNNQDNTTKNVLYTNNNGPKSWCNGIVSYLDEMVGCKVFDKVIRAWEVDGNIVEPKRTSHLKTYEDLVRCLNVHEIKKVCFIDDQEHPLHQDSRVTSYKIPEYNVHFTEDEIIERLRKSSFKKVFKTASYQDDLNYYNIISTPVPPPSPYKKKHDVILFKMIKKFMKPNIPRKQTRRRDRGK